MIKATPRLLALGKRPGTHSTGDWESLADSLDGNGRTRLHRGSKAEPSSPQRVTTLTELSRRPRKTQIKTFKYVNEMSKD